MNRFTNDLWLFTLAIAGDLVLAWILAQPAHAEPVVLSFTDPVNCQPCKVLERTWQESKPATRRVVIDVRTAERQSLKDWGVTCWPTTFLVDMEAGKVTRVFRRKTGAMDAVELRKFLGVPK